jgi:hypothetical protein
MSNMRPLLPRQSTQFQRKNPGGGRPKGSKNKISEDFLQDFHAAWLTHGKATLEKMIAERPSEFVKIAASLIPKNFHIQQAVAEQPVISIAIDPLSDLTKRVENAGSMQPPTSAAGPSD